MYSPFSPPTLPHSHPSSFRSCRSYYKGQSQHIISSRDEVFSDPLQTLNHYRELHRFFSLLDFERHKELFYLCIPGVQPSAGKQASVNVSTLPVTSFSVFKWTQMETYNFRCLETACFLTELRAPFVENVTVQS